MNNKQAQGVTEAEARKIIQDIMNFAKKRYPEIWGSYKEEYQTGLRPKKIILDFSILISDNK